MAGRTTQISASQIAPRQGLLRKLGRAVHSTLLLALLATVGLVAVLFVRSAARREPAPVPATMSDVDWASPDSSGYCLACHKPIARAASGLDVEQGHSQNVRLNPQQLAAVRELGTVVGPQDTLVCTTCHMLGAAGNPNPFMLADELHGSRLCIRCHPNQLAQRDTYHDLRVSAPDERNRLGQTAAEGGPCSACHLAHHYAREFDPCEVDPDGRCITCHEMARCAQDLSRRQTDHPDARCTACHNPHDDTFTHFLKQDLTAVCADCHAQYAAGPAAGMHPLGLMDRPIPQQLQDAGAPCADDMRVLTCVVCHETHVAVDSPLLRTPRDSNATCLECHQAQLASRTPDNALPRHGQAPVLDAEGRATVADWEGHTGSGGELLCLSCHRVHRAVANTPLLAFGPSLDEGCTRCHAQQAAVIGTPHDLRTNHPEEENVAGMTAAAGGACSACHLGHGPGRPRSPGPGDATGACTSCHEAGRCAGDRLAGDVLHPNTTCTDCHDPHARTQPHFLARPTTDLCVGCHSDQSRLAGGPHDRSQNSTAWPEDASSDRGLCLPCHAAHGGARGDLYRLGTATNDCYHDDACLTCHPDAGWNAAGATAILHPHQLSAAPDSAALKLVPRDDRGNLRIACRTCHDPHGGAEPMHLARVASAEPTENLCLQCHSEKRHILSTGHAAERLAAAGFDVDSCKPCHAMHAEPGGKWGRLLSPRFLLEGCAPLAPGGEACIPCLACHRTDGPAPLRDVFTHPPVTLTSVFEPDTPGYLPLFSASGTEDPQGQVVCRTCHLAHGWPPKDEGAQDVQSLSDEQKHALRYQLRQFTPPNLCTSCHGFDGLRRFLYFHDKTRRGGPPTDVRSR